MSGLEVSLGASPWMARGCFASVLIATLLVQEGPAFGKPKPSNQNLNSREARGGTIRIPVLAPAQGPVVKARPVARAEVIAASAPAAGPGETRQTESPEVIAASPLFPILPSWDREPSGQVDPSVSKPRLAAATSPSPSPNERAIAASPDRRKEFIQDCIELASEGLKYKFGSNDPESGGLDCSGIVQYLLQEYDVADVPRQSNHQYHWLEEQGTLTKVGMLNSGANVLRDLKPGNLLFWKDTYNAHRHPNVTHVMVYLGFDRLSGKHKMFGARASSAKGDHGHAVDIFDFDYPFTQGKGEFIAYGSVPGLRA